MDKIGIFLQFDLKMSTKCQYLLESLWTRPELDEVEQIQEAKLR